MPPEVDVHLLPTGRRPTMRYNDFTRSAELISMAYEASSDYLAGRRPVTAGGRPVEGVAAPAGGSPPEWGR